MKINETLISQCGFANYVIGGIIYNLFYLTHGNKHGSIHFEFGSLEHTVWSIHFLSLVPFKTYAIDLSYK